MADISTEYNDIKAKQNFTLLKKNITDLGIQNTANETVLTNIKATVKGEVGADTFNVQNLKTLVQSLDLKSNISKKLVSIKTQMQSFKNDFLDETHKTEIQTEIDKL